MNGELFDSTIPFGEPELLKAGTYQRYLDELDSDTPLGDASTRLTQLSPSLSSTPRRLPSRCLRRSQRF